MTFKPFLFEQSFINSLPSTLHSIQILKFVRTLYCSAPTTTHHITIGHKQFFMRISPRPVCQRCVCRCACVRCIVLSSLRSHQQDKLVYKTNKKYMYNNSGDGDTANVIKQIMVFIFFFPHLEKKESKNVKWKKEILLYTIYTRRLTCCKLLPRSCSACLVWLFLSMIPLALAGQTIHAFSRIVLVVLCPGSLFPLPTAQFSFFFYSFLRGQRRFGCRYIPFRIRCPPTLLPPYLFLFFEHFLEFSIFIRTLPQIFLYRLFTELQLLAVHIKPHNCTDFGRCVPLYKLCGRYMFNIFLSYYIDTYSRSKVKV